MKWDGNHMKRTDEKKLEKIFGKISKNKFKCDYLHCVFGMGLAGFERCAIRHSNPYNPKCPAFKTEEEMFADHEASRK